jgi:molecular chaperone GrpE
MTQKKRIPVTDANKQGQRVPEDEPAYAGRNDPSGAGKGDTEAPSKAGGAPGEGRRQTPAAERSEQVSPELDEASFLELSQAVEELTAMADSRLESLQRMQAEFDNYRKRARREIAEASEAARGSLLRDFLPVLDNLSRALDAAEHHEEGKVLNGVKLTESIFLDLLSREGVQVVDPLGQSFDPALHEAMAYQPADQPEGTVIAVVEKGYLRNDRVLRPAKVAVSAGAAESG